MKKLVLILGILVLFTSLGLRAYFVLVPPPEPTLHERLADIVPNNLSGWQIQDKDMAESPESSQRISDFLNFDDSLFRVFQKDGVFVGLYIAYWTPGKASYRWAGAHTPDTCWVLNGWTREAREYAIPFECDGVAFEPAEFGIYEKDGLAQNVYFWHLVGGKAFSYSQKGDANIFNSLTDIKNHGLNLRKEQYFIRLSSNKNIDTLKDIPEIEQILKSLMKINLLKKSE